MVSILLMRGRMGLLPDVSLRTRWVRADSLAVNWNCIGRVFFFCKEARWIEKN